MSRPTTPNGQIQRFLKMKENHSSLSTAFDTYLDKIANQGWRSCYTDDLVQPVLDVLIAEGKSQKTAEKMANSIGNRADILLTSAFDELLRTKPYEDVSVEDKKVMLLQKFNEVTQNCFNEKISVVMKREANQIDAYLQSKGIFGGLRVISL